MALPRLRDPRRDATALLPAGHVARVLEPSPPADPDPAWRADDPTDPGGDSEAIVVSPTSDGDRTWDEVVDEEPGLAGFAADHWLGARRRLRPLPEAFETTRRSLHRLAFFVLAPVRYRVTSKLGLRYTARGFGTPFFGDDIQVRVEAATLVHQRVDAVRTADVSSLSDAARFLDLEYREVWFPAFHDPLPAGDPDAALEVEPDSASVLADWFGFTTGVLEELRRTRDARGVGRVQLWPEHFDLAVEIGPDGARATCGASPGDDAHPEPYLYVAPWPAPDRPDPYWNDPTFGGASLTYGTLADEADQFASALHFLRRGHALLTG